MFHRYQQYLSEMDLMIEESFPKATPLVGEIALHLIKSGGKRLRPLFMFAFREILGKAIDDRLVLLATAVEMLHTATLMHDDIIDRSEMRRGQKTAHTLWGEPKAILVGDFLFSCAFKHMAQCQDPVALSYLSNVSGIIIEGEIKQFASLENPTLFSYLEIVSAKTASLFEAACVVPGLLDRCVSDTYHLKSFGKYFAYAFQTRDDILDYFGEVSQIQKNIGRDFLEKKLTLPSLLALKKKPDFFENTFDDALSWLRDNNIEKESWTYFDQFFESAFQFWDLFPNSLVKKEFKEFLSSVLSR